MARVVLLCLALIVLISLALSGQAQAAYTWTVNDTSTFQNGSATFSFTTPNSLSITLENTAAAGQLDTISSILDGVSLTLSNTPSGVALAGAQATGTVTVTATSVTFANPGISDTGSTPFQWGIQMQGGTILLFAGGGSYHPYEIVNGNITSSDGLSNGTHNPYLNGPVTFNIGLTGLSSIPDVTSAGLYFGTTPDIQPANPTPLPSAILLLGPGLIGLAAVKRRIKR